MTWKDLAAIVPSVLVGWFAHAYVAREIIPAVAGIVMISYLVLAGFSVVTCLTTPRPRKNSQNQWMSPATNEMVEGTAVFVWYHGVFVLGGLVLAVWFSAALTLSKGLLWMGL